MEFSVQDSQGHSLAKGSTDNPYQVRNILLPFLSTPHTLENENVIHTKDRVKIWCSASLPAVLQLTPRIIHDTSDAFPQRDPTGPEVTLRQICREHNLDPGRCRRILRRHYGVNNQRYSWRQSEVPLHLFIRKN